MAAYQKRGRRFKELSQADLGRAWATAFEFALGLGRREYREELDDLGAEFQLRPLEPPVHLVERTMKQIKRRILDMSPEAREAARKAIGNFREKMNEPKN